MDNDPFDRIPEAPIAKRDMPSVAPDPGDQKFVPAYALERQQEGGISSISGADVILAIIASGGVFTEKTGCDSGTPYTYWAPEWTDDPTP